MKKLFLLFLLLCQFSCVESSYDKFQMMSLVKQGDPEAEIDYSKEDAYLNCSLYRSGCKRAYLATVIGYQTIFVEFDGHDNANREALRKKGLVVRNWLIDNIQNEPPLIAFMKKHLKAKEPVVEKD